MACFISFSSWPVLFLLVHVLFYFQLFLEHCILQPAHPGAYHYMPSGLRALEKLIRVIDEELQNIGAQKMSMPTMMRANLWVKTGTIIDNSTFLHYPLVPSLKKSISEIQVTRTPLTIGNQNPID